MSWLNTLLDVASFGVQMSQAQKLSQLQSQHADGAMIQAVVQALRGEIFKYKQAAEEVLALEQSDPKATAAVLDILSHRLQAAGIKPELFPELGDKEYVVSTQRLLRDNRNRLMAQLSPVDQTQVEEAAALVLKLPKYQYYLDHYDQMAEYRAIYPTYADLKQRNTKLPMWSVRLLGLMIFCGAFLFSFATGLAGFEVLSMTSCLGGVGLALGSIFWARHRTRPAEYEQKKRALEKIQQTVDVQQFFAIEQEVGTDPDSVRQRYQADQRLIDQFFGNSNFQRLLVG
jgi:hypothetical protein